MSATLSAIFDDKLVAAAPLPFDEELDLIARAQDGDKAAYETLLMQYAHGLRALADREYARAGGYVDAEETRANVALAFAEALAKCDGSTRIAAKLKAEAKHVADDFHLVGAFSVPTRSRARYMQAVREAGPGGDAEAKAAELGMTADTFQAARAVFRTDSLDELVDARFALANSHAYTYSDGAHDREPNMTAIYIERGYANVDEQEMCRQAFAAVDGTTGAIMRDAYGFTEFDPLPDAEIAHRMGFTRSKVQRLRSEGLVTMREALEGDE
jgi:hypothetical protein